MKEVSFNVYCNAVYHAVLPVDDCMVEDCNNVTKDELENIINYINDNLGEVSVTDLEWLEDFDVEEYDIDEVYEI